jgi:tRNA threonylcarbamoyladenosine modification (KEOPS) complex Cgi121 subunit
LKVCKIGKKYVYFHTVLLNKSYYFTLDDFRKEFPGIFIQGVNFDIIYNYEHIYEILKISNFAKKRNIMCSNKIELDFLLRIVGTNQILQAINIGGLKINNYAVFVIVATRMQIDEIKQKLIGLFGNSNEEILLDNEIKKRKFEKIKRNANNSTLEEKNLIKFLNEIGALVTL